MHCASGVTRTIMRTDELKRGKKKEDIRMWFLSLDMAATASSWERNSTSASPVDLPLGATSMWTLNGFKGEKNYKNKERHIHRCIYKWSFYMTINIQ